MTDLNGPVAKLGIMDPILVEALGYMQRPIACPEEVRSHIAALRVPVEDVTGTRLSTNWRSGSGSGPGSGSGSRGGWGRSNYSGRVAALHLHLHLLLQPVGAPILIVL
jgi:hypothetical protein